MSNLKFYRKKERQPMRPYIPGEDLSEVFVGEGSVLEEGGMIAVSESNQSVQWYICKDFFEENYELAEPKESIDE